MSSERVNVPLVETDLCNLHDVSSLLDQCTERAGAVGGGWLGRKILTVNIVLFVVIYTLEESLQVSLVAHTNQAQREGKPLAGVYVCNQAVTSNCKYQMLCLLMFSLWSCINERVAAVGGSQHYLLMHE